MKIRNLLLAILLLFCGRSFAQYHHEFLAKVTYQNFSYQRIDSFPGVTYIADNTAYDQDNKHFFFQGNDFSLSLPWNLFTVDAITGSIIYQVPIPANLSPSAHVCCLQYDNVYDTLYGVYYLGTQFFSCWIDPSTGNVTLKQSLPGINGYAPGISTYDENNHRIIFHGSTSNGGRLAVIDAVSGNLLAASQLSASGSVCNIEYDNTHNHLYGIRTGTNGLDSIEVLTGVQHLIAYLPSMGLMQNGISAIDEANNKFIFCGVPQPSNVDSLYTLDLATGAILNQEYYAFANSASLSGENIIFYCMDQLTGDIYALNWGISYDNPEGLSEIPETNAFELSPNPANSKTIITLDKNYQQAEVFVFNAQGALVQTQYNENTSAIEVNTNTLAPGLYFLAVNADCTSKGTRKLVVGQH